MKKGKSVMKNHGKIWLVIFFSPVLSHADELIYSNNFNGAELKASGITAATQYATTNNGVLEASASQATSGLRVDLTSLNLTVGQAIKITADVYMPNNSTSAGIGFGNTSTDWNLLSSGDGALIFATQFAKLGVYATAQSGGELSASSQYTLGAVSKVEYIYHTTDRVDILINGVAKYTGFQLAPTGGLGANTLDYAFFNLRLQAPAASGGMTFDNVTIEIVSAPARLSLFVVSSN